MDDNKAQTIRYYDSKAGKLVERYRHLMSDHPRPEFDQFIAALPKRNESGTVYSRYGNGELVPQTIPFTRRYILDMGAGGGDHAQQFTKKGLGVTCIDLSPEMVGIAKAKGLEACVMDMEDIKLGPNLFHGIWAVTSLPHVPKVRMPLVVDKMWELLKPEGVIYACVKYGKGEGLITDRDDPATPRFFAFYQDKEFRSLFPDEKFDLFGRTIQRKGRNLFLQYFFRKKGQSSV